MDETRKQAALKVLEEIMAMVDQADGMRLKGLAEPEVEAPTEEPAEDESWPEEEVEPAVVEGDEEDEDKKRLLKMAAMKE